MLRLQFWDPVGFKSLLLSIGFHLLVFFFFFPVIFFPKFPSYRSALTYLGSISSPSHTSNSTFDFRKSILGVPIASADLRIHRDWSNYERVIGLKTLPKEIPLGNRESFDSRLQRQKKKRSSVFFEGTISTFPDGKKYHFVPRYLHYNSYKQILIFRRQTQGYEM